MVSAAASASKIDDVSIFQNGDQKNITKNEKKPLVISVSIPMNMINSINSCKASLNQNQKKFDKPPAIPVLPMNNIGRSALEQKNEAEKINNKEVECAFPIPPSSSESVIPKSLFDINRSSFDSLLDESRHVQRKAYKDPWITNNQIHQQNEHKNYEEDILKNICNSIGNYDSFNKVAKTNKEVFIRHSTQVIGEIVKANDVNSLKAALIIGANVNKPDIKNGFTPLHYATCYRKCEMMNILIDNGANVNILDSFGLSPLGYAVNNSFMDAAMILVERNARFKFSDNPQFFRDMYAIAGQNNNIAIQRSIIASGMI
jgi:hypothetical protein